jgi:putative membrane protein
MSEPYMAQNFKISAETYIMKKILIPACLAVLLSFNTSCNNEKNDSTEVAEEKNEQKAGSESKTEDDNEFAVEAASGGLMEVELGQYAATNAASAQVKEFGQRMVTDHTKANDELKALASSKNITLPTTPGDKHQKHINDLKEKKGADFDKAYMSMMVDDHEEDVKKFQDEADNGKDAELKAFAAGKVSILKSHLDMARSIKDALK